MLTTEELLSGVVEGLKVSIAINIARLLVEVDDEDGNPLPDETVNENLTAIFHEITEEIDATLEQVLARMQQVKLVEHGETEEA